MEGGGARQGKAEPSRGRRPHQIFCMNSNLEMTMLIQRACLWQLSLCHFHSELEYTVTISLVVSFSFRARIGFGPTVACSFPSSQNSASESFRCCCCF
ncbi:hypothetical protein ACS0TY_001871 [Phlomoides rotata]